MARRLVELQDDLLPFGDGRLAALRAERGEDRARRLLARAVGAQHVLECFAVTHLHQPFAAVALGVGGRLDRVGDIFRAPCALRSRRTARWRSPRRRSRRRARRADRRPPGWCASAAFAAAAAARLSPAADALTISTTCACASASVSSPVAAAASWVVRSRWENATSASSCIGPGSGSGVGLLGRSVDRLERIERRDGVGESRRRRRQGGRENGERRAP